MGGCCWGILGCLLLLSRGRGGIGKKGEGYWRGRGCWRRVGLYS